MSKKILSLLWGECLSHSERSSRILDNLEEIADEDLDLYFMGSEKYLSNKKNFLPLKQLSHSSLLDRLRNGKFSFYDSEDKIAEDVSRYIENLKPIADQMDIILTDCPDQSSSMALDLLSESGHLDTQKIVNLCNVSWSTYRGRKMFLPEGHFISKWIRESENMLGASAMSNLEKLCNTLIVPAGANFKLRRSTRRFNSVYKRFSSSNKNPYEDVRELFTSKQQGLILFPDLEEFDPANNSKPTNSHYIGPLPFSPSIEVPEKLGEILNSEKRNIVYLTMGSTGDVQVMNSIIDCFDSPSKKDSFLVLNTGNQKGVKYSDRKEVLSDNFYITDFLPGEEIIPNSSLVIFQGGSTTFYQIFSSCASNNSWPSILALSTHSDQEDIGRVLESRKIGKHLPSEKLKNKMKNTEFLENLINSSIHNSEIERNNLMLLCKSNFSSYLSNPGLFAANLLNEKYLSNNS